MSDTEKITVNVSVVNLGQIDLIVSEGLYANRTDFIRTAIRGQLNAHVDVVKQSVTRNQYAVGIIGYTRGELERRLEEGEMLKIRVVGMLVIANSVPPELASATIKQIKVFGAFRASKAVKEVLADRTG
jgi:Arc/MetJ-type ribon-helix-helix transcriptional regulator